MTGSDRRPRGAASALAALAGLAALLWPVPLAAKADAGPKTCAAPKWRPANPAGSVLQPTAKPERQTSTASPTARPTAPPPDDDIIGVHDGAVRPAFAFAAQHRHRREAAPPVYPSC